MRFSVLLLLAFFSVVLGPRAFGQAGNDNPGGVTAEYNGSVTTAGSYDPYTGNAKRQISDIVVPGSIGAYPLTYTRTFDTRGSGTWTHDYSWSLYVRPPDVDPGNGEDQGGLYDGPVRGITYPNGGRFDLWTYDSPYNIQASGPHGTDDRLFTCSTGGCTLGSTAVYELWRSEGGKVLFEAAPTLHNYRAYAIVDPFGQTTTLAYYSSGRLWKVTEPGGRYLELVYEADVLTAVRADDGRGNTVETVSYGYEWVWQGEYFPENVPYLNHVYYDDGAVATYTYAAVNHYEPANTARGLARRVLHTCDDPRYAGAMKQIEYEYVSWTEVPDVGRGQIKAEKNILGQVVSRTTYPTSPTDPNLYKRTETRGDGPSRTITYGGFSWTDFKNKTWTETPITTPPGGWQITDARNNTTTHELEPVLGAVQKITYPQTNPSATPATREYSFSGPNVPYNPYYRYGEKDENGNWTYFDRDPNTHQITQIRYPDGSTEGFTYNAFGQVETHRLRSGGTENFRYDTRGLKTLSWPPPTPSDPSPDQHPTVYTYYQAVDGHPAWIDRLKSVKDPLNHYTWFEYNQRGQVSRVTHHDGYYTQSHYNVDGTLDWTADENHPGAETDPSQRTRYTYDQYKRILTVTDPMGHTTENCYALDSNWADTDLRQPLLHTTNAVKFTKSPMQKNVVFEYDANFRKTYQGLALGTVDASETRFDYDEVGNLTWTRDPRLKVTTFGFDQRNRKTWMDDPIASDRSPITGHTMTWEYDDVGNKLKEIRADDAFRSWHYDAVNRIDSTIDWRVSVSDEPVTTLYGRDVTSTVETVTDSKGAIYTSQFDALHRKTSDTLPLDAYGVARTKSYWYDAAGHLAQYQNPAGQNKYFSYDNRNREIDTWWDAGGPWITKAYDAASRLTGVATNGDETRVNFGYDDANRKIWEEQTLRDFPTRHIDTPRDDDGNRLSLGVANFYYITYGYTERNQLKAINGFATFQYDQAGNLNNRTATWIYASGTNYGYDDLNRVTLVEQGNAWEVFSSSHYQYDKASREVATWRDQDNGLGSLRGERFGYNALGQLTSAKYDAEQVWTGTPLNALRNMTYNENPLNRQSVVADNGFFEGYFTDNGMNQYTNVGGLPVAYDGNFNLTGFNGMVFTYNAENQLVDGSIQATYDGLGRCVKRTVGGVTRLFTYDDWKPFLEWDGAGNWLAWNVYGAGPDEIIARNDSAGHVSIYKQDQRGNVVAVLDQNGNVSEKYTYDAFGKPTVLDPYGSVRTGGTFIDNRFMFTGREWIKELGLYDYRHRIYFPGLGRFLQTDPTGFDAGDMNLFRYCGDDPVDGTDPTGLMLLLAGDRKFRDDVYKQLQELWKNGGDAWRSAIAELANSQNYHVLEPENFNQTQRRFTGELRDHNRIDARKDGPQLGGRADARKNNFVNVMRDAAKQSWGETKQFVNIPQESGSTIKYNPAKVVTRFGPRPAWIGLGHELAHSLDMDRGTYPDSPSLKPLREGRAIWWENQARENIHWTLRGYDQIE